MLELALASDPSSQSHLSPPHPRPLLQGGPKLPDAVAAFADHCAGLVKEHAALRRPKLFADFRADVANCAAYALGARCVGWATLSAALPTARSASFLLSRICSSVLQPAITRRDAVSSALHAIP